MGVPPDDGELREHGKQPLENQGIEQYEINPGRRLHHHEIYQNHENNVQDDGCIIVPACNRTILAQATDSDPPYQGKAEHQRNISVASTISESAFLPSFTLSTPSYFGNSGLSTKNITPSFSLSFRQISTQGLVSSLSSTDVSQRLALMLCVPWRGAVPTNTIPTNFAPTASQFLVSRQNSSSARNSFIISTLGLGVGLGVATISCLGIKATKYCVARLILPNIRIYIVCLRERFAHFVAAFTAGQRSPEASNFNLTAAVLVVREPRASETTTGIPAKTNSSILLTAKQQQNISFPNNPIASTPNNILSYDPLTVSALDLYKTPEPRIRGRSGEHLALHTPQTPDADDKLDDEMRDVMTEESVWSRRPSPRRMTIQKPTDFEDILSAGPNSPIRPIPLERIGDSPLLTSNPPSATLTNNSISSPSRDRADSATTRLQKRLSLNFAIQPASSRPSRPPSWHASPLISPDIIASPTEGNFLTVLAHQERKILELREELRRAEVELTRLKKQWSNHEAFKQGQEVKRGLQLQPLKTNFASADTPDDDLDGGQQWMQKEMDRRKAMMSGVRSSGRKVFSGSRHTRTLSLLSPDKGTISEPFPMSSPRRKTKDITSTPLVGLERATTSLDIHRPPATTVKDDVFADNNETPKDAIMKTGKQMVGDIREGLWTFFEDIRQAAVGDEAISSTGARAMNTSTPSAAPRNGVKQPHDKKLARHSTALINSQPRIGRSMTYDPLLDGSISNSFWSENGLAIVSDDGSGTIKPKKSQRPQSIAMPPIASVIHPTPQKPKDIEDSWVMWGTPAKSSPDSTPLVTKIHSKTLSTSTVSSSPTALSHDGSRPSSPSQTLTPQTLTPESLPPSQRVSIIEPLSGDSVPSAGAMSKRSSGVWTAGFSKLAGVEHFKRTATQILADWERGVAADAPRSEQHPTT